MESVAVLIGRSIPAIVRGYPGRCPQRAAPAELPRAFRGPALGEICHRSRRPLLRQVKMHPFFFLYGLD